MIKKLIEIGAHHSHNVTELPATGKQPNVIWT